jgi:hypothetical protein
MPDLSDGVQAAWQIAAAEVVNLRHERLEPLHLFIGVCSIEKLLSAEAQEKLQMAPSGSRRVIPLRVRSLCGFLSCVLINRLTFIVFSR